MDSQQTIRDLADIEEYLLLSLEGHPLQVRSPSSRNIVGNVQSSITISNGSL